MATNQFQITAGKLFDHISEIPILNKVESVTKNSRALEFSRKLVNLRNRKRLNKTIESVKSEANTKKKAKRKTITKETTKGNTKQFKKLKASTTDTKWL